MGKLFGTDGIRGIYGDDLTNELAFRIGASTAEVLSKDNSKLKLLIGSDTRFSKDELKEYLAKGLMTKDVEIIDLGVIPTPAISYLIKKYNAQGGFVISASHNPSEYNGIKVFNSEGFKLADNIENEIESIILSDREFTSKEGKIYVSNNAKNDYVDYLLSTIDNISNIKIGIDTANGSAYETAKMLFDRLNVDYEIINCNPDGYNINNNCGSTHIESLKKLVIDQKLDIGIAFDGDADRCLLIDDEGNLVDGDKILAIYGNYLKDNNKLVNNTIVGTIMSNLGLVKFCEKENINFVSTKVGDRYVLESMLKNNYILGGEQSGHIIFKEYANTGDGELTAIQILSVMSFTNKKLSDLSNIMDTYPQVLKNVSVSKEGKETWKENITIKEMIDKVNKELNNEGRVLVRESGTENLIRVMLEGKDIEKITKLCDDIVEVIKKELV